MSKRAGPQERINRPASIVIRAATEDDLNAVAKLWEELIQYHNRLDRRFWRQAKDGRAQFRDWMAQTLGSKDRVLLVAEISNRVVGFTHGMLKSSPPPMKPRRSGFITDMAVTQAHRHSGVGRRLMTAVEEWFRRHGADEITLTAAVRNKSGLAFWEAMGFEVWTVNMWRRLGK